jgi:hypothetical protein
MTAALKKKKKCPKCGLNKNIGDFHKDKNQSSGLSCWCKKCVASNGKKFYRDRKKKGLCVSCSSADVEKGQLNCIKCSERAKTHTKKRYKKLKEMIIRFYCGGKPKCMCPNCPITAIELLTIDHIYGGGRKFMLYSKNGSKKGRRTDAGSSLYCWIVSNDFPSGFQILCGSCNMSKGSRAQCPRADLKH